MRPRKLLWLIILLTLLAVFLDLPSFPKLPAKLVIPKVNKELPLPNLSPVPIKLGLDLQGGVELVLQAQMDKIAAADRDDALESARQVIERRVNGFGVSEAVVQSAKVGSDRRILVDLPGVSDASQAANLVGKTAELDFREEPASYPPEASQSGLPPVFFFTKTNLTGADLQKSQVTFSSSGKNTGAQVEIQFTPDGAKKFDDITKRNVGKPLAIFLDDQPVSYNPPIVQQEIIGGNAVISGNFTSDQAKQLAIQLNAGALKVPVKILSERSISASLGQESVQKSLVAGGIGLVIVILYMIGYYGWLGLIADVALIIYTLLVLAIFKTGLFILPPVTLTLPGIAGFILSIGMAVDANILIFERMKEEKRWGKLPKKALELGFNRAWSSIRDSNISSLITASILYYFGVGLVRGFAITLAIGVLVSMFTAVVVTRTFLRFFIK